MLDTLLLPRTNGEKSSLPDGWRWVRLGEICKVITGTTPSTSVAEYWNGDIVWITPADLGQLEGYRITSSARHITKSGQASCGLEIIPPNSVVLSSRAPIGYLGITDVPLCTNQGCKSFVPCENADADFVYFALKRVVPTLQALGSGATFAEVSKTQLQNFEIPLPPLPEQKRIAAILTEQMAAVERARTAAQAQLQAARKLPAASLCSVFGSAKARGWPIRTLGEMCKDGGQYGTSEKSTDEVNGSIPVLRMGNIVDGRIDWKHLKYIDLPPTEAQKYLLKEGDILFNRTNSAELVGKSAVFDAVREAVFASYIIRFRVAEGIADPDFLCSYINSPYGRAFIEENMTRAIGQVNISASTMQKMRVPCPPIEEQKRIAVQLKAQIEAAKSVHDNIQVQLEAINKLPVALLRMAFSGQLTQGASEQIVIRLSERIFDKRGALSSYAIARLYQHPTFGRIQHMKIHCLVETHLGIPLEGEYERQAAGPFDVSIYKLENIAKKESWFTTHERESRQGYYYLPGPNISERLQAAETLLGDKRVEMDRLLDLFATMDTEQAEMITTLYAAWNDFLIDGLQPTDDQIIREVRENWHESKKRFTPADLQSGLEFLRQHRLIPKGTGPHTKSAVVSG